MRLTIFLTKSHVHMIGAIFVQSCKENFKNYVQNSTFHFVRKTLMVRCIHGVY